MECRPACGACCIAPSISTPIPGMPNGKPAGQRCIHLDASHSCTIFGHPDRPEVCARLQPQASMCADSARQAYAILIRLERATRP